MVARQPPNFNIRVDDEMVELIDTIYTDEYRRRTGKKTPRRPEVLAMVVKQLARERLDELRASDPNTRQSEQE